MYMLNSELDNWVILEKKTMSIFSVLFCLDVEYHVQKCGALYPTPCDCLSAVIIKWALLGMEIAWKVSTL